MQFALNSIYTFKSFADDTVRVLYVFDDALVVISLIKENTLPYIISKDKFEEQYEKEKVILRDDIHYTFSMDQSQKQELAGEKNWNIIKDLVMDEPNCFDKKFRSTYIRKNSESLGVSRLQIQRLLYKYWAGGKIKLAVYPDFSKRGAPGKERITDKKLGRPVIHETDNHRFSIGATEKKQIEDIIKKFYNRSDKKHTYHYCYKKLLSEYYTDETTKELFEGYPTETQFNYHAAKAYDLSKRNGSIIYNKDIRGIIGSSRSEADGPGDVYQIDATIADIYLVSKDNRSVLVGRPILYFVLDVFSRMIVGFHCCLEYASWDTAKIALLCAFSEKALYCKQFGRDIANEDWPCSGLPRALIVDNGELIGLKSDKIIENLGITVKNAPAWRPDMKGIVESSFRLLNLDVKSSLPGGVYPDFTLRTGRDYRYDAKLTLEEFTKIILAYVLGYNKHLMKQNPQLASDIRGANVPPIPIELWRWGEKYRTPVLRKIDEDSLKIALMANGEATITERGIKFQNMFYVCDRALKEKWFDLARAEGTWTINVAYNQSDMSRIYYIAGRNKFEICQHTKDSAELYAGLTLEEVQFIHNEQIRLHSSYERADLQNQLDTDREINEIIAGAEKQRKVASIIRVNPGEIRKNRRNEISRQNEHEQKDSKPACENNKKEHELVTGYKVYTRYDSIVSNLLDDEDDDK